MTEVEEVNAITGWLIFDQVCRREMSLTAEEFLTFWRSGVWSNIDLDDVKGLVDCWMLLPCVEEL